MAQVFNDQIMETTDYTGAVPAQEAGRVIDSKSTTELADQQTAVSLFRTAKTRLLDVNGWREMAGRALAHFQLTDAFGIEISDRVHKGNYFKIDTPGPGTEAGKGYDWVRVEAVESYSAEDVESIAIRVRPAANPAGDDDDTAHFYSDDSTSTFIVTRENTRITAMVCDRNIKINKDSENFTDQVRNTVFGLGGMAGLSKIQWESLTDGLIRH